MLAQRLLWGGGTITSAVMTYLAFAQVEDQLARWSFGLVFGLLFIASMMMFPWGQTEDGSPRRPMNFVVRGHHNPAIMVSTFDAPVTSSVVTGGSGNRVRITLGTPVTVSEIRQISIDASRAEVLPAARAAASQTAITVIEQRCNELTDRIIDLVNQTNTDLFARWDDPRFLAALTSAQRCYAESGNKNQAEILAQLVAKLAQEPAMSTRELLLRQAMDCASKLSSSHYWTLSMLWYRDGYSIWRPKGATIRDIILSLSDKFVIYNHQFSQANAQDRGLLINDFIYMTTVGTAENIEHRSKSPMHETEDEEFRRETYGWLLRYLPSFEPFTANELPQEVRDTLSANSDLKWFKDSDFYINGDGTPCSLDLCDVRRSQLGYTPGISRKSLPNDPIKSTLFQFLDERKIDVETLEHLVGEYAPDFADLLAVASLNGAAMFKVTTAGYVLAAQHIYNTSTSEAALMDEELKEDKLFPEEWS